MRRWCFLSALTCAALVASPADAAPPEPSGAHPRLWLDAPRKTELKKLARQEGSAVSRAIHECQRVGANLQAEAKNLYMALDWAAHTSTCALAWQATGDASYAKTALHFWNAMLDDWETVGDGKGGDMAARHDSGYAIRAVGVHTAIGYDWLHDAPGMTPAMLAHARQRLAAWIDWYPGNGYRSKDPGTNYHAGYLFAATITAIAQGSEAGAAGTKLWTDVVDRVWGKDMAAAAVPGALLDGGDWGEGWQYGPLAVASYGLSARAMIANGVPLPAYEKWANDLVLRHVHALNPAEKGTFVGGDTQSETPSLPPSPLVLVGVVAGPGSAQSAGWADSELSRLKLAVDDRAFLAFEALSQARGATRETFPRDKTPTFFIAKGTGRLYARSSWSHDATWLAMQCTKRIEVDHLPANAGNFVLTRGADELVVDPSPYGSLSSLTSNAPTVESPQLPADYKPSQAYWSEKTGFRWARQTASAITVARCDYADQYKFQERPSDIAFAQRDLVVVPSTDGDATAVVIDRMKTGGPAHPLHLRFRTLAELATTPSGIVRGTHGASSLTIATLDSETVKPTVKKTAKSDCFQKGVTRGGCQAARFPVNDFVRVIDAPTVTAVHVLDLAAANVEPPPAKTTTEGGRRIVAFSRGGRTTTVVAGATDATFTYRGEPGRHVVLMDGQSTRANVTATKNGAACNVTVSGAASGGMDAMPLVFVLSDACAASEDPTLTQPAKLAGGSSPPSSSTPATVSGQIPPPYTPPFPSGTGYTPAVPQQNPGACGCRAATSTRDIAAMLPLVALAALLVRRRVRRS
jgi:hypothetical protein